MLIKPTSQLLVWLIYLIYYYAVNKLDYSGMTIAEATISTAFFALIAYSVYGLLRFFFAAGRYLIGTIALLANYSLLISLAYLLIYGLFPLLNMEITVPDVPFSRAAFAQTCIVMLSHYSLFALLYFYIEVASHRSSEKNHFEFLALSGQLSPHVVVNMVSRWRVLQRNAPEKLIIHLTNFAELLRYYLQAGKGEEGQVVPLEQELEEAKHLCAVLGYKELTGEGAPIQLKVEGEPRELTIPPTTLLTLIENAIKYGRPDDALKRPVLIVHCFETGYHIELRNHMADQAAWESHGFGLNNLIRRMELIYGEDFSCHTRKNQGLYHFNLKVWHKS